MWFCSSKDGVILGTGRCHWLIPFRYPDHSPCARRCPSNHKQLFVKRLIGLPGEWIQIPGSLKLTKIPEGHCWVEGDNSARSWDSRAFGPVSLFLLLSIYTTYLGAAAYNLILSWLLKLTSAYNAPAWLHWILMVKGIFGSMVGSCCGLFHSRGHAACDLKRPVTSNDAYGKNLSLSFLILNLKLLECSFCGKSSEMLPCHFKMRPGAYCVWSIWVGNVINH